jgi:hypothetical protein
MPDLSIPGDATEAALLFECWEAVVSYAALCATSPAAGTQLATEAFTQGVQAARTPFGHRGRGVLSGRGAYARAAAGLPRIPLLLIAVRSTAAVWEAHEQGHRLDPDLRMWLMSEQAARHIGPPARQPLALRGLREMEKPDAALLWAVEVESLPLPEVARKLGLNPAQAAEEITRVRKVFRECCHRSHFDMLRDEECRSYARLLDAVTRTPGAAAPGDLSRHLARCVECGEAAACLRLRGDELAGALAAGVLGWGGLAYLERRRRAVEGGLAGEPSALTAMPDLGPTPADADGGRVGRARVLAAAMVVSLVTLVASLVPLGGSDSPQGTRVTSSSEDSDRLSAPHLTPSFSELEMVLPSAQTSSGTASASSRPDDGPKKESSRGPEGKPTSTASGTGDVGEAPDPGKPAVSTCRVTFGLVNEWPGGFQGTATVVSEEALDGWRLGWKYRDGQRVTQLWGGRLGQEGAEVTVDQTSYNTSIPAGRSISVGFLGTSKGSNSAPYAFTLNGRPCATGG